MAMEIRIRVLRVVNPRALDRVWGGPLGPRAAAVGWLRLPLLILLVLATMFLAVAQKQHCREQGWTSPDQFTHACYSDVPLDYQSTALAQGDPPYLSNDSRQNLAQPVLTGLSMWALAKIVPGANINPRLYFDLAAIFLALLAVALVLLTQISAGGFGRPAILVAVSPVLLLSGLVSLDLLGVTLTATGLWLWGRSQPLAAGIVFGLACTARTYPAVIIVLLGFFALRAGRLIEWINTLLASSLTLVVVITPWLALNPEGIRLSYRTWAAAAPGFGSLW
ncbi:MAG: hypothetical protein ACRC0L_09865, partial [Angustibacter sp.]